MEDARTPMMKTFQQFNAVASPSDTPIVTKDPATPTNASPSADDTELRGGKPKTLLDLARHLAKSRTGMPISF